MQRPKINTILQINATANIGSTGKIAEQINQLAQSQGWKTYLAYGRSMQPSESELIHVGNKFQVYEHYAENRLFDNDGLASRIATQRLIGKIKTIKPDLIHLHNIHDHWLNYRILFEYLNTLDTPIVWTQHDCWAFTGGCAHFTLQGCYRWSDGGCTNNCPMKQGLKMQRLLEKTEKHYRTKKGLFTSTKNMVLVSVSHWLEDLERKSFLKNHRIQTIHNGIDISAFRPSNSTEVRKKYDIGNSRYVIGVSSVWLPYKGWNDFMQLSVVLPQGMKLVMVGLKKEQIQEAARNGIIGIPRTDNTEELAALYSGALLTLNLSRQETFGLTTVEGFACGTPGIVYNATASPELIDSQRQTGWVVEQGDLTAVTNTINDWLMKIEADPDVEIETRQKCRERAKQEFNKEDRFAEYMALYNELMLSR